MLFARIKNSDNVLVLQAPSGFCLAKEPLACVVKLFAFKLLAQSHGLDGDDAANFRVFAQLNHAHRALAQLFFNLVAAKHGFFDAAAFQQHGAARVRTAAAQNNRFRQVFGTAQLRG